MFSLQLVFSNGFSNSMRNRTENTKDLPTLQVNSFNLGMRALDVSEIDLTNESTDTVITNPTYMEREK